MSKAKFLILISMLLTFSGCSMKSRSTDYCYLNNEYVLNGCWDIHNNDVQSLSFDDYDDYSYLFDFKDSYMNYQCKGTSLDNFWCEGSIKIKDKNGNVVIHNDSFSCLTDASLYYGKITFVNEKDAEQIGNIYVYAPYWCRIQIEYSVVGGFDPILLTFQFWKGKFNTLPDFLANI